MFNDHTTELIMNGVIDAPSHYGDVFDDGGLEAYWKQYYQGLEAIEAQRLEAENASR